MKAMLPMQFGEAWSSLFKRLGMMRLLVVIVLGTLGLGMTDVLLEPSGGQVLGLSVTSTTKLTALLALGSLIGFGVTSRAFWRRTSPVHLFIIGAAIGTPRFLAIIASPLTGKICLFLAGTFATRVGAGLFGHATLTKTICSAPANQIGLSLRAWGRCRQQLLVLASRLRASSGVLLPDCTISLKTRLKGPTILSSR